MKLHDPHSLLPPYGLIFDIFLSKYAIGVAILHGFSKDMLSIFGISTRTLDGYSNHKLFNVQYWCLNGYACSGK